MSGPDWRLGSSVERDDEPVGVPLGAVPGQPPQDGVVVRGDVGGEALDSGLDRTGPGGRKEGVKIAQELLAELRPLAQGVYLMPSFGRYEVAAEVLEILDVEKHIR